MSRAPDKVQPKSIIANLYKPVYGLLPCHHSRIDADLNCLDLSLSACAACSNMVWSTLWTPQYSPQHTVRRNRTALKAQIQRLEFINIWKKLARKAIQNSLRVRMPSWSPGRKDKAESNFKLFLQLEELEVFIYFCEQLFSAADSPCARPLRVECSLHWKTSDRIGLNTFKPTDSTDSLTGNACGEALCAGI